MNNKDLKEVVDYLLEHNDKQAETNKKLTLMFDNVNKRCEYLEEHMAMLVDTLLDMDMHKQKLKEEK